MTGATLRAASGASNDKQLQQQRKEQQRQQQDAHEQPAAQDNCSGSSNNRKSTEANNNAARNKSAEPRRPRPTRPFNQYAGLAAAQVGVPLRAQIELAAATGVLQPPVGRCSVSPPKRPAQLPARFNPRSSGPIQTSLGATVSSGGGPSAAVGDRPNRYGWIQMQEWHARQQQQAAAAAAAAAAASVDPATGEPRHFPAFHHHFPSPFASAASRVLYVNPIVNHLGNFQHTRSRLIKFIEALKRFSEKWFSHVLLLMFLAVYACLGAYVFISFEAPTEQWEKQQIIEMRARIVNESFDAAQNSEREQFFELFRTKFEDYERLLNRVCQSGMTSSSLENQWTFWGALFYSMTVFTTIGYGHLTPITFAGRVATMAYAIFGIPILLMVLADLGKLLTRIIKFSFKKFRYFYNKLLGRKAPVRLRTEKLISDNTNQYFGVARDALERGFAQYIQLYQNRLPSFGGVRARMNKRQRRQQQQADSQQQPFVIRLPSAERDPQLEASDVIVTPHKQTKPMSPKMSSSPASKRQGSGERQSKRAQSPANQSSRRKISSGSKQHSGASLIAPADNKRHQRSSVVSRSSSASNMLESNAKRATDLDASKKDPQQATSAEAPDAAESDAHRAVSLEGPERARSKSDEFDRAEAAHLRSMSASVSQTSEFADDEAAERAAAAVELMQDHQEEPDDEDEFDIPVSFALLLLITYMMLGAFVFSIWEGWNFFDALYFVFISMSTIGFGDLVPQHPKRMVATFAYLLFGLALTSMCINVVQEKIHATFLRAKMQIGEKMGFDLEQIMADDYYGDIGSAFDDDSGANCAGQGDENDCICVSSTSVACQAANADQTMKSGELTPPADKQNQTALPIAKSKSKDSLKGLCKNLPGPVGSKTKSSVIPSSFRCKSTSDKLKGRPASNIPTSVAPNVSMGTGIELASGAPAQAACASPIKAQVEPIKMQVLEWSGAGAGQPSINQPVNDARRALCEPITKSFHSVADPTQKVRLLAAARPLASPLAPSKSLDSSASSFFSRNATLRRTTTGAVVSSPRNRSLGSSRRASISHELSQLDNLIVALSRSPPERFGPLLGIPTTATGTRPSRSTSPGHTPRAGGQQQRSYSNSNSPDRWRASTVDRSQAETHASSAGLGTKRTEDELISGKPQSGVLISSVPRSLKPVMNSKSGTPSQQLAVDLSESQAALEELEAVKFSAV